MSRNDGEALEYRNEAPFILKWSDTTRYRNVSVDTRTETAHGTQVYLLYWIDLSFHRRKKNIWVKQAVPHTDTNSINIVFFLYGLYVK